MDQEPRTLIKRHNEYVREQVVHDLEALEEKLNVKRHVSDKAHEVVDKAKGTLGMKSQEDVHGVGGFVRANAVPLMAVGLGGALLARNATKMQTTTHTRTNYAPGYPATGTWEQEDDSSGGLKDKLTGAASGVKDKLSGGADTASSKASDVKGTVADKASGMKDSVSDAGTMAAVKASELKDTVSERIPDRQQAVRMAKENAPALGLAAMAIGAVAGAFIPRTRMEEERIAPLQENVVHKATDMVEETVDKAKGALQAGAETVGEQMSGGGEESSTENESESLITTPNRITGAGTTGRNQNGLPASSL